MLGAVRLCVSLRYSLNRLTPSRTETVRPNGWRPRNLSVSDREGRSILTNPTGSASLNAEETKVAKPLMSAA